MAAQHEGGHVFHRHVEFFSQEVAEPRAVEHAGHAHDLAMRQAGKLAQGPHHRVERIGDADDESVGAVGADPFAHRLHHLEIDAEQIVAAHAWLARHAGGHDHDVAIRDVRVVAGAFEVRVEPFDGARLAEVERLARRHAFRDIEQDDVAQFLHRGEVRQRAADHAGTDEGDLVASFRSGGGGHIDCASFEAAEPVNEPKPAGAPSHPARRPRRTRSGR